MYAFMSDILSVLITMYHSMGQQAAAGLLYLADHNVVHRDVAARNVLIQFTDPSRFVCKLTDFGLSRVFDKLAYHSKQTAPIPVRWTALEVRRIYFTMLAISTTRYLPIF